VEDGIEAMRYLKKTGSYRNARRPDIILLDLNLPKQDGREVLKKIKKDPRFRSIPVIVLTTSTSEEDIADAYALHANCYICKPNDLDQFISVVNAIETMWFENAVLPSPL
jgi:CheY-like chemotaxis protein